MSQASEQPGIQEDPILTQYEALKEELGLTDEEVQALKKSRSAIVHKVNRVIGADAEEKAAQLVDLYNQQIKRIKKKLNTTKEDLLAKKTLISSWNKDKIKKYTDIIKKSFDEVMNFCGDDLEKLELADKFCSMRELPMAESINGFNENLFKNLMSMFLIIQEYDENGHKKRTFTELLDDPMTLFELINADDIYKEGDERFFDCLQVLNQGDMHYGPYTTRCGTGRLDSLKKAKEIYENDEELYKLFFEIVTKETLSQYVLKVVDCLVEYKHLFIQDKELTKRFIRLFGNFTDPTKSLKALDKAKKMCDRTGKDFGFLLDILENKEYISGEIFSLIVDAYEKYGDDEDKFERFVNVGNKHWDDPRKENITTLGEAAEAFPDEEDKFNTFAGLIEESNYYPAAVLLELKSVYEEDEEKFQEVLTKIKGIKAEAIKWIFKKDLFQHINGSEVRFNAYIKLYPLLCHCTDIGDDIKYVLSTSSNEMLKRFTNYFDNIGMVNFTFSDLFIYKKEVYGDDIKRLEYTAAYLEKKYPRNKKAMKLFVDLAEEQGGADDVDMKQVGEFYAKQIMQSENWAEGVLEIYKNEELREFMPEYLRDFFGVIAQVNLNTLSSKLNSHFEPFNFEGATMADKLKVLHVYGEFLTEFNGTMVPTVWYLYYLLKDPLNAKKYLTNIKDLNNMRELENIATLDDLHNRIYDLKEGILLGSVDLKHLQQSDLALAVLDDMAKVSASEWKRESRSLSATVEAFQKDEKKVGKQFKSHVYKSGFIPVREITEPFGRDEALDENVSKAQTQTKEMLGSESAAINNYKNQLKESIGLAITKAQTALDKGVDGKGVALSKKAKVFTSKKIENFNKLKDKLSEVDTLEDILHLCLTKEAAELEKESIIRGIFYYLAAKKQGLDQGSWLYSDPRQVDASTLLEFIEDTILFEVIQGKSSEDGAVVKLTKQEKKAVKREFATLLNFLKQKNAEEAVHKEKAASSTKNIAVVAGRDLLAELSGFYCDACWTSQIDILKNNPTMVGHTMVENFEQKEKAKIIGGCLTLESSIKETDEETGEENNAKVLIVRGLNPQQQYLKKYDVGAFVESFLDYVQEAGRKAGAEYVVLPLHNLGALSNRPEVINYLKKKYGDQKRVSLSDDIDFNGYKIKDACVVVRTISENKRQGKLPKPSNIPLDQQETWIGSW